MQLGASNPVNVRSKIIKDHLNDPAFYDKMSTLLSEILADLRAKRIDYEEFLKRVASLASQVQHGAADNTPEPLKKSPGLRAIYNQLEREGITPPPADAAAGDPPGTYGGVVPGSALDVSMRIDAAVRSRRPDGWRGVRAKEFVVKSLIHEVVPDTAKVERLFLIVKAQTEY